MNGDLPMQENKNHRRGLVFILSSPSGAGKSTLSRKILAKESAYITLSTSATTRKRRGNEVDGVDYHFMDEKSFFHLREQDALLEWAEVHGHYYGTPKAPVIEALSQGKDVFFDIDWQGTQQMRDKLSADLCTVFLMPPSMRELKGRLQRRAEDPDHIIEKRLKNSLTEMQHWREYDYVLINDDLDNTYQDLCAILHCERLKRSRQIALEPFVQGLFHEAKDVIE